MRYIYWLFVVVGLLLLLHVGFFLSVEFYQALVLPLRGGNALLHTVLTPNPTPVEQALSFFTALMFCPRRFSWLQTSGDLLYYLHR